MKFYVERKMFTRCLCALCFVFAFACMWGCGDWFESDVEWNNDFGGARVVGFIDDSLVIVYDFQEWSQDLGGFISDHGERNGLGHQRLRVFNYRVQEDGPRWSDTLNNSSVGDFDYVKGQLSDSVIWGAHGLEKFSFWKIGSAPVQKKLKIERENCEGMFEIEKMRPWVNGLIIGLGKFDAIGNICQYVIADTAMKTLTYKRLDKDLEWIRKCDDVRAWGDDVYCFMPGKSTFEAVLLRNGVDTIDVPVKFTIGDFWGDVLRPNANLCSLTDGRVVCSGVIWRGGLTFYENDEVVVNLE